MYCSVLYCVVLYCTVLHTAALYATVLYATALYYAGLRWLVLRSIPMSGYVHKQSITWFKWSLNGWNVSRQLDTCFIMPSQCCHDNGRELHLYCTQQLTVQSYLGAFPCVSTDPWSMCGRPAGQLIIYTHTKNTGCEVSKRGETVLTAALRIYLSPITFTRPNILPFW